MTSNFGAPLLGFSAVRHVRPPALCPQQERSGACARANGASQRQASAAQSAAPTHPLSFSFSPSLPFSHHGLLLLSSSAYTLAQPLQQLHSFSCAAPASRSLAPRSLALSAPEPYAPFARNTSDAYPGPPAQTRLYSPWDTLSTRGPLFSEPRLHCQLHSFLFCHCAP